MKAHQQEFKFQNGDLLEEICELQNLHEAFKLVKRNKGAAGIDGITVEEYGANLDRELGQLRQEVLSWSYKPIPVKRVEIPKPKGKGVRMLGVPIIKDRILHMAIKRVLDPLIDPTFSNSSYGFRPGRNQRQAVEAAQEIVRSGKEWVVDIDLSKFFDRINHDRLIYLLKKHVKDKRVLRLIGNVLRSGIMTKKGLETSSEGSVQGSPLSPLLSNIVLDELDKELEKRGHSFCRYADDSNIFVSTERAAKRVMESIKKFIEEKLKLKVNEEKSQVAPSNRVKFLGMTIIQGNKAIAKTTLKSALAKVKSLIPRGSHLPIEQAMDQINKWYKGWVQYYSMTQYPAQLKVIEAHVRRRLRARLVRQQKRGRHLWRKLVKQGVPRGEAKRTAYSNKGTWRLSHIRAIEKAYPNRWFIESIGQEIYSNLKLADWFAENEWVKLV